METKNRKTSRLKPRNLTELQIVRRKMTNWQNYQYLKAAAKKPSGERDKFLSCIEMANQYASLES